MNYLANLLRYLNFASKHKKSIYLLCSQCFRDRGLKMTAHDIGTHNNFVCPNCKSKTGVKLKSDDILDLAHKFFVWGTLHRFEYGAAPIVQFNELTETSIDMAPWLIEDTRLIEKAVGVGFFYYGPRLWMLGEVDPLKELQYEKTRANVIQRIFKTYPERKLYQDTEFYRIRISPDSPNDPAEYDAPPNKYAGKGRLDSPDFPVLYGSQDLEVCLHECRVSAEDDVYFATLQSSSELRLLDLTKLILEPDVTEFESLDMAVHMLFLAGQHSYQIAQTIASMAKKAGFDGIIYPSYYSMLRTGGMPFETVLGISHRQIKQLGNFESSKIIPNLALFGRPIEAGSIQVKCINKLILNKVTYSFHTGPVGLQPFTE